MVSHRYRFRFFSLTIIVYRKFSNKGAIPFKGVTPPPPFDPQVYWVSAPHVFAIFYIFILWKVTGRECPLKPFPHRPAPLLGNLRYFNYNLPCIYCQDGLIAHSHHIPHVRVDPEGRCAVMLCYLNKLVVIPFKKEATTEDETGTGYGKITFPILNFTNQ